MIAMRAFTIVTIIAISCTTRLGAQLIHYDVLENDPFHFKNLSISVGLWGFSADKTNTQKFQNVQLNLFTQPFCVELKYVPPVLYYSKQVKNKYRDNLGINGFRPTYTPYEATLVFNLKKDDVEYDARVNLRSRQTYIGDYVYTDTRFIDIPANKLRVKGLRIGAQEMYSTSQYTRHLSSSDSIIAYHPFHTFTSFLGFDYKMITNHHFKVPSYGKDSRDRKIINYFADIMYAPIINVEPDSNGVADDVEKRNFGWRVGIQYIPCSTLGIYFRTELGTHPGVFWKGNLFFSFGIGLDLSMRTYKKKSSYYY
jgi:hypothetical protein